MSFENAYTYQRRPLTIRAVRLTATGQIPGTHTGATFIRRAIDERRIVYSGGEWIAYHGEAPRQIAYPGQWLVFTGDDLHASVMDDADFRALFDAAPAENEEEVA